VIVTVRPAVPADAAGIEDVRFTSWQAAYGEHIPAAAFAAVDRAAVVDRFAGRLGADGDRTVVAEVDGAVTGFAMFGPCRDADLPDAGEVYSIYVRPAHWSTGQGRALLAAAVAALGSRPLALWVLADNVRARRFYEIAGWRVDGAQKAAQLLGGVTSPEVRYRLD
jgi:GNAT superfamily N-acetyltransferase